MLKWITNLIRPKSKLSFLEKHGWSIEEAYYSENSKVDVPEVIVNPNPIELIAPPINEHGYRLSPYSVEYIPDPISDHPFISIPVNFCEALEKTYINPVLPNHNEMITLIKQAEPPESIPILTSDVDFDEVVMNGYGVHLKIDEEIVEGFIDMGQDLQITGGERAQIYHEGKYHGKVGIILYPTGNERSGRNDEVLIQSIL